MKRIIIYAVVLIITCTSCKKQDKGKALLPHVTGAMNDVVLIMSPKNWESEPGEEMKKLLLQPVVALPQAETQFDIVWMPHDAFTKAVKKQRNIILTKIGPEHKTNVTFRKSIWAQSQLLVQISAPNKEEFVNLINSKGDVIVQRINDIELERVATNYKKSSDKGIEKKLLEKHKIKLTVPKGFRINHEDENFVWLDNRYRNTTEGILVYYYPYIDSSTFSQEFLVKKRNAILKQYVPGEKEGSYPITENRFPLEIAEYDLRGKTYTYEMRGLWNIVDGFAMGGPFVNITQYDKKNNRIVSIDGFIFAPGEEKRNLIKHIEAILYSVEY